MVAEASPRVLITGGAGFVGRALRRELRREGSPIRPAEVRVLDLEPTSALEGEPLVAIRGDIRDAARLRDACDGIDLVLHCAALVDWGQHGEEEVRTINVDGTRAVIEACRDRGVRALVHTSTLDVVYTGDPIIDGDESLPVPSRPVNAYCGTKAEGEAAALAANEVDGLRVAVLRPACIWGEGDPYHAASLIEVGRKGPVVRIGDGSARCQHVYVGNVAWAHLLAGAALLEGRDGVAGEVFFVTDFPAQNFFDYMEPIVVAAGYRMMPWRYSLPRGPMRALGVTLEGVAGALRPIYRFTPTLSRFAVDFVCHDYTIRTDKAERAFGYTPRYCEDEALRRTIEHFREVEGAR